MPKSSKGKEKTKPKVLFGYLSLFIITLAAIGFTYKGFIDLTKTQQTISEPSKKLIKLNSIIADIYEAESNIRTYTLTQNESYLSLYLGFMKNINAKVDSLLILAQHDPVQIEKIRFTQELLNKKRGVLRELIELKKTDQSSRFYAQALEEVESINIDSVRESSVIRSVTTTTRSRRDSVINLEAEEQTKTLFNKLMRWFSRRESADSTVSRLFVEVETQIDTLSQSIISPSDSLLTEVIRILTEIQEQQEMAMLDIGEKEIELLKSDKAIMDQLRTVLSLLEREELMNSYKIAEEVKRTVKESTIMLVGLGMVALLMVILFTWNIFRDISRASYYRAQLLEAKQLAEKLLCVKEEFLANMNHEIRTPLSAIIGLSKRLKQDLPKEEQQELVHLLNGSSQHLLQIVNDILDLSKIEGEYLKLEEVGFLLDKTVEEAFNLLAISAREKGLSFSMTTNSDAQRAVIGDPLRLKQVIYNLLSNAIKFTPKGEVNLNVDALLVDEERLDVEIRVSDTGIGIPSHKLNSIFDQFSQVESGTSRKFGGTGLGLNIAKRLIELQGGTIAVTSEVGEGSEFLVNLSFPLAVDGVMEEEGLWALPQLPPNTHVLVVEDDPIGRLLIKQMLTAMGITPVLMENPMEALELVKEQTFSVVITDIQMPEMNGFQLAKAIHTQIDPAPPIVAISANSNLEQQSEYAQANFAGHIVKPFNEVELYNAIAPLVGEEVITYEKTPKTDSNSDYDISDIQRFASHDNEATCVILQSFMDNAEINLKHLKENIEQENWQAMGELAHKMKSAFRQLKVYPISNTLEQMEEDYSTLPKEFFTQALVHIESEVVRVNKLLKDDIEKLQNKQ